MVCHRNTWLWRVEKISRAFTQFIFFISKIFLIENRTISWKISLLSKHTLNSFWKLSVPVPKILALCFHYFSMLSLNIVKWKHRSCWSVQAETRLCWSYLQLMLCVWLQTNQEMGKETFPVSVQFPSQTVYVLLHFSWSELDWYAVAKIWLQSSFFYKERN